jgi:hypothetical protein
VGAFVAAFIVGRRWGSAGEPAEPGDEPPG